MILGNARAPINLNRQNSRGCIMSHRLPSADGIGGSDCTGNASLSCKVFISLEIWRCPDSGPECKNYKDLACSLYFFSRLNNHTL